MTLKKQGRPTKRNEKVVEEIIERISVGETLTDICKNEHLPSIRSFQYWCIKDNNLDDAVHRARIRGTLIRADEAIDAQRNVINGTTGLEAKQLQAVVTAANNMGHQANAQLTRIDKRYKDKSEVAHSGPVVVGWDDQNNQEKIVTDAVLDAITSEHSRN